MPAQPKRKLRHMLTLIPEEERAINYRFTVVVVGETAREFAQTAVSSDMAEAYRPKSCKKLGDGGVEPRTSNGHESGDERQDSIGGSNDKLVLFCPTGSNTKDLARLRLHPCCGFSESMPLTRDYTLAKSLVVAFLFWQVKHGDASATEDTIREWYSRMAEINHMPASLRPLTVVLAFEADGNQTKQLRDFIDRQAGKVEEAKILGEASEDTIVEALQELAAAAIAKQDVEYRSSSMSSDDLLSGPQKGRCCTIL